MANSDRSTDKMRTGLQVCVIPFRDFGDCRQYCLIRSRKGRWIFPKGGVKRYETLETAAMKEAWEEAGLEGILVGPALGRFDDCKRHRQLTVYVVTMDVTFVAHDWPERQVRHRQWCRFSTALQKINKPVLRDFLCLADQSLSYAPVGAEDWAAAADGGKLKTEV